MKKCCALFVLSVGVMASAGVAFAARTVELNNWEFRREGGAWSACLDIPRHGRGGELSEEGVKV